MANGINGFVEVEEIKFRCPFISAAEILGDYGHDTDQGTILQQMYTDDLMVAAQEGAGETYPYSMGFTCTDIYGGAFSNTRIKPFSMSYLKESLIRMKIEFALNSSSDEGGFGFINYDSALNNVNDTVYGVRVALAGTPKLEIVEGILGDILKPGAGTVNKTYSLAGIDITKMNSYELIALFSVSSGTVGIRLGLKVNNALIKSTPLYKDADYSTLLSAGIVPGIYVKISDEAFLNMMHVTKR